jgi:hypothetical protein
MDGTLQLTVGNADGLDCPERILKAVHFDDWKVIVGVVQALEFARVDSIARRPLELTDKFGERWIIA